MFPTLSLGPVTVPTGNLVYLLGAWLALSTVEWAAKRLRLNATDTYGVAVAMVGGGFVGARLVFVALHWEAYAQNLVGIVWPLTGGFNLWGGLLIGVAAGVFYGRAKQLPPAGTLDALAPGLVVALLAVSLADFLAGPGYGVPADLPWSIDLFGVRRHPVQVYEIVVGLLALGAWWWARERRTFPGRLFLVVLAVIGAGRLFVDAFRANAWLTGSGYHVLQIISLTAVVVSLALLGLYASRPDHAQA